MWPSTQGAYVRASLNTCNLRARWWFWDSCPAIVSAPTLARTRDAGAVNCAASWPRGRTAFPFKQLEPISTGAKFSLTVAYEEFLTTPCDFRPTMASGSPSRRPSPRPAYTNDDGEDAINQPLLQSTPATDLRGGKLTIHQPQTSAGGAEACLSYSYAYGPSGISGLAHNRLALACAIFASLGGLTFGYDQGVIANVLVMKDFVARWPIGAWEQGLMSACPALLSTLRVESGCLWYSCGAWTWVPLWCAGIRCARRQTVAKTKHYACLWYWFLSLPVDSFWISLSIYVAVFSLGSLLQCAAESLLHLIVGRAIGGLGVGALRCVSRSLLVS